MFFGQGHGAGQDLALVLQGGGALGAYHVGAYQAMEEYDRLPTWVAGISIGAIQAAIIAGNEPGRRLEKLHAFWNTITWPPLMDIKQVPSFFRPYFNYWSSLTTIMFGQPNFFQPRGFPPFWAWEGSQAATSFYDTGMLRSTLLRLVDFDLINQKQTRLSLGAVNIQTGEPIFFDNTRQQIGPEHVMASAALPPGFPAIPIEGEYYWDGGCVSNTPLDAIVTDKTHSKKLVFMVDLFNPQGKVPRTMDEVFARQKDIQYASHTKLRIQTVMEHKNYQRLLHRSMLAMDTPQRHALKSAMKNASSWDEKVDEDEELHIIHIVYQPSHTELSSKDYEFSRLAVQEHQQAGYREMSRALDDARWRDKPDNVCAYTYGYPNEAAASEEMKMQHARYAVPSSFQPA